MGPAPHLLQRPWHLLARGLPGHLALKLPVLSVLPSPSHHIPPRLRLRRRLPRRVEFPVISFYFDIIIIIIFSHSLVLKVCV